MDCYLLPISKPGRPTQRGSPHGARVWFTCPGVLLLVTHPGGNRRKGSCMPGIGKPGIGKRIQQARIAKGMTQMDVALPDFTHAYISLIEAERRSPSAKALEHIAKKLGVTADELKTGRP